MTQKTIDLIKHYEGLHDGNLKQIGLQPKMCPAGYLTIGYGHVVIDPLTNRPLSGEHSYTRALELFPALTIQEAEQLLYKDLERFIAIVNNFVTVNIEGERMGALDSFCYNIGQGNFRASDVLRYTNQYQYELAADSFKNFRSAKVNGVKTILPGLVARRKSESLLYLTGELKFFN